ncbi:unnamed protein product [Agarophyton chilense]
MRETRGWHKNKHHTSKPATIVAIHRATFVITHREPQRPQTPVLIKLSSEMGLSRDARRRAKEAPTKPVLQTIIKKIGGEKNGGERKVVINKGPKWYPADDIKKPVPSRKHIHKPTKLRSSISPGTILILLAGRLRGSRVIYLGQLPSGKLLVTGPYSVNRIPLRRVDQAYVIATSTALDVSAVDISKFDDAYFKRVKSKSKPDVMETDEGEAKYSPTEERIADQKVVDQVLIPILEKESMMTSYLKNRFSLKRGMYPHAMKF